MDISVVVPLYNEAESLPELTEWIERVMNANGFSYEILFINDGSTDDSPAVIKRLAESNPAIHLVSFARNYGKSPALDTGFRRAKGDVVITMDADLQDSPDEIPELYRMITAEGYDLVSGWKKKRYDPLSKTIRGVHQLFENIKLLFLILSHHHLPMLRQNRQVIISPLGVLGVIAVCIRKTGQMAHAPADTPAVALQIPVLTGSCTDHRRQTLCNRWFFGNYQFILSHDGSSSP